MEKRATIYDSESVKRIPCIKMAMRKNWFDIADKLMKEDGVPHEAATELQIGALKETLFNYFNSDPAKAKVIIDYYKIPESKVDDIIAKKYANIAIYAAFGHEIDTDIVEGLELSDERVARIERLSEKYAVVLLLLNRKKAVDGVLQNNDYYKVTPRQLKKRFELTKEETIDIAGKAYEILHELIIQNMEEVVSRENLGLPPFKDERAEADAKTYALLVNSENGVKKMIARQLGLRLGELRRT